MSSATAVVERWARATDARLRETFRQAAQDVADNVSVGGQFSPGTPVDLGFALNKWDATLGTPSDTPLRNADDASFAGTNPAMALTIASADLGDTITIYNNTEYLPYLEDGSTTPRAPYVSGWIAQTVHAWPTIVAQAVARVRGAR
jgi:hypothetical protein